MKKLFLSVIAVIMMMVVIPCVSAAESGWMIEDIVDHDSLVKDSAKIYRDGHTIPNKTTITYSAGKFVLLEGNGESVTNPQVTIDSELTSENIPDGYAWIGFKIKRMGDNLEGKKLKVQAPGEADYKELEGVDYTSYVGFNKETLEKAMKDETPIKFTYNFMFDEEKQTIEIDIIPEGIILYGKSTDKTALSTSEKEFDGEEEKKKLDDEKSSEENTSIEEINNNDNQNNDAYPIKEKAPNTAVKSHRSTIIMCSILVIFALTSGIVYKLKHN